MKTTNMSQSHLSRMWDIEPPVTTISDLQSINQLISRTSKTTVKDKLSQIRREYPQIRNIRGDGNCFYRSIAFLHIKAMDSLSDFYSVFPRADKIDMTKIHNYPEEFSSLTQTKRIIDEFRKGWQYLFGGTIFYSQAEKENYLTKMLNAYWLLDFFIIVYFRCINLDYIEANYGKLERFTEGKKDLNHQLTLVACYGEDSQGIEIESMTMCLNEDIKIMFVRSDASLSIKIGSDTRKNNKVLLLTPGHYDILYHRDEVQLLQRTSNMAKVNTFSIDEVGYDSIQRFRSQNPIYTKTTQNIHTNSTKPRNSPQKVTFAFDHNQYSSSLGTSYVKNDSTSFKTSQSKPSLVKDSRKYERQNEDRPLIKTQVIQTRRNSQINQDYFKAPESQNWGNPLSRTYKELQIKKQPLFIPPIYNPNTGIITLQEREALKLPQNLSQPVREKPFSLAATAVNFLTGLVIILVFLWPLSKILASDQSRRSL